MFLAKLKTKRTMLPDLNTRMVYMFPLVIMSLVIEFTHRSSFHREAGERGGAPDPANLSNTGADNYKSSVQIRADKWFDFGSLAHWSWV